MASMCFFSCSFLHFKNFPDRSKKLGICKTIYSSQSTSKAVIEKASAAVESLARRSGNYAPSLWSYDQIQSLSSEYKEENYKLRSDTLKDEVNMMIRKVGDPLSTLELIDDLQRLGISYHFEEGIRERLEVIYCSYYKNHDEWNRMNLNLKALGFRLLRQHGYQVCQEIFHNFKDKTQNLKPHLVEDMMGLLNLYEASYHAFEDESILDDALDFTTNFLKKYLGKMDASISPLVSHALDLPLHWRVTRVESKWFIGIYEKRSDMNPTLLELAKLDFDIVQAIHIEDLKHTSRWWKNTSWDTKLSFGRDRVVLNFLWTTPGYLPRYSLSRRTIAKVNCLITTIDDVYDVYGTLDELEQFTEFIDRWDINAVEELPDYMKICFLGFYNTINEIAYDTLINTGIHVLPYFKKAWAGLCKAYLVEARWYYSGYTPTLQEYLDNASVSISAPVILMHTKFAISVGATHEEILQYMERFEKIDHYSSLILRLVDDLATSTDELARGDISKSIHCYMHDTGATEEEARGYIKEMIRETWKKLNKERMSANSQFSREYIEFATDLSRMAQFVYGEGDGHGNPDLLKSHVLSLIFNPIQGTKQ